MKKVIVISLLALTVLTSCKLSMNIYGVPGTDIYAPNSSLYSWRHNALGEANDDNLKLGTIGNDSVLFVKLKKYNDHYHSFLLAKLPGSNVKVPFATNIIVDKSPLWQYSMCVLIPYIGSLIVPLCANFDLYNYTDTETNTDLIIPQGVESEPTDTVYDIMDILGK